MYYDHILLGKKQRHVPIPKGYIVTTNTTKRIQPECNFILNIYTRRFTRPDTDECTLTVGDFACVITSVFGQTAQTEQLYWIEPTFEYI